MEKAIVTLLDWIATELYARAHPDEADQARAAFHSRHGEKDLDEKGLRALQEAVIRVGMSDEVPTTS